MAKFFCCPNCFAQFEKDNSILMLSSGAAIVGGRVNWSGNLERDIDKIERVKYCKNCRKPLDFHALLRGKLDYYGWGVLAAYLGFLLSFAAFWFWLDYSFWSGVFRAAIVATAAGFLAWRLDRLRLGRWRLSDDDVAKLTAP
jgi:hypothetical protein